MTVVTAEAATTHELHGARFTPHVSPSRGSAETSVWQVEIPPGVPGVVHALTREEVLVVLAGQADVTIGDEDYQVTAGDTIVVPAHTEFQLTATGDESLRAFVCLPVGATARVLPDGEPFTPPWAQ